MSDENNSDVNPKQAQEVLLKMIDACRDIGLNDDQAITAIGGSLVAFAASKNIENVKVEVDGVGSCEIVTKDLLENKRGSNAFNTRASN